MRINVKEARRVPLAVASSRHLPRPRSRPRGSMRRYLPTVLLALAAALPATAPARAQDTVPRLTAEAARGAVRVYNDPHTLHLTGGSRVAQGTAIRGNVAALDGDLAIAGRVDGSVVVING